MQIYINNAEVYIKLIFNIKINENNHLNLTFPFSHVLLIYIYICIMCVCMYLYILKAVYYDCFPYFTNEYSFLFINTTLYSS